MPCPGAYSTVVASERQKPDQYTHQHPDNVDERGRKKRRYAKMTPYEFYAQSLVLGGPSNHMSLATRLDLHTHEDCGSTPVINFAFRPCATQTDQDRWSLVAIGDANEKAVSNSRTSDMHQKLALGVPDKATTFMATPDRSNRNS